MENNEYSRRDFEEQRRRKAENFHLSISDNYDYDNSVSEPEEINSYSGQDVKEQIAKESKKSLKKRQRERKRELRRLNKRNRRYFRIMWIVSIIIIGVMASTYVVTGLNDMLAINRTDDTVVSVKIPENPTLDSVASELLSKGVINESSYFKMFANITKAGSFKEGTYQLKKNMDYQAILTNLAGNASRTDTVEVTIIEGMNMIEISDKLVESGALSDKDKDKFLELCASDKFDNDFDFIKDIKNPGDRYYKLEGYLYPDKYEFYEHDDPLSIIYKFLNNFETKLYTKQAFDGYEKLYSLHKIIEKSESPYTLDQLLTIASIIQAEAANKEDMYYISSIIHNRLTADADLGVANLSLDSTKFYPYRSADKLPATAGKNYKSKYDTYTLKGLPPGPICNPGMEAIKAALQPFDTSYYYFCHDKDGNAFYASTFEEHQANLEYIE